MSNLNAQFYFLSPVEVVKVTPKNLQDVADWCSGTVERKESNRVKGRIDSFVAVPTPRGAAISMAFPGMFVTKRLAITENDDIKDTYSVFRRDYFNKNYFDNPTDAVNATWERHESEQKSYNMMMEALQHGSITINLSGAANPEEVAARVQEVLAGNDSVPLEVVQTPLTEDEIDAPLTAVEQRELIVEDSVENAEPNVEVGSLPDINNTPSLLAKRQAESREAGDPHRP